MPRKAPLISKNKVATTVVFLSLDEKHLPTTFIFQFYYKVASFSGGLVLKSTWGDNCIWGQTQSCKFLRKTPPKIISLWPLNQYSLQRQNWYVHLKHPCIFQGWGHCQIGEMFMFWEAKWCWDGRFTLSVSCLLGPHICPLSGKAAGASTLYRLYYFLLNCDKFIRAHVIELVSIKPIYDMISLLNYSYQCLKSLLLLWNG